MMFEAMSKSEVSGASATSASSPAPASISLSPAAPRHLPAGIDGESDAVSGAPSAAGDVTSGSGWRRDPFTGTSRFHAGVDIRASYGRDVAAVAGGRVVS